MPSPADDKKVVFIDSGVPDIRDLIAGLAPGVQAFVLAPSSDGVQQIADILAANDLADLSSISIVGHGAAGEVQLGSSVLDTDDLSGESAGLAQIGAALAPGGDLQLYACDVASGATGQQFIADLSQYIGGAPVAASSSLVGAAAEGGSWALNVDTGTANIASPFTAAATAAYSGMLSLTSNQIFFDVWSGNGSSTGSRIEQFGVNGSSPGGQVDVADDSQSNGTRLLQTTGAAVDTALNAYFVASYDPTVHTWTIQKGNITGGGGLTTLYTDPLQALNANFTPAGQPITGGTAVLLGGLALDAQNGELYFARDAEDYNSGDYVPADTGIYKISVTGGAATRVTDITTGSNPNYLALDTADNLLFFDDSIEAAGGFPAIDNLDVVNLTTGAVTVLKSFFNSNDTVDLLQGLAVSGNTIYLTTRTFDSTSSTFGANSANNAILSIPFTVSGSGSAATASVGAATALYSGSGAFQPTDIVVDAAHGIFYTTGSTLFTPVGQNQGDVAAIFEGSLSGGTSLTQVLSMTDVTGAITGTSSPAFDTNAPQLVLMTQPIVTAGATVSATSGGGAVTADAGTIVADADGQNLAGATVTGALTGDTLSFNGGNPKTFGDGDQISSSFSGGTLTLSGNATAADYQSALDSVTFSTTSTSMSARTLGWTVNDGVVASATASSTVNVLVAPMVNAGGTATFTGGGSPVELDPALTISDPGGASLTGATVSVSTGFISGDTLHFIAQNGISEQSYTGGVLTLTGVASATQYTTALESITYSFTPSNGDPTGGGGDTSRTIDWAVSEVGSGSATATSTLDTAYTPPVNQAPSGTSNTVTTLEDTAYVFGASDFGFSDVDGNDLQAVEITTTPGAGTLTDNGTAVTAGQFVSAGDITGGKLVFTPATNANGAGYAGFTFQVQDDGGTDHGGANTDPTPRTMTIDVTAVNDAPEAVAPGSDYAATGFVALDLKHSGLSVSDVDGDAGSETLTLSVGEGALSALAGSSGVTLGGSATALTVGGTTDQINAFLNTDGTSTLSYTDATLTPSAGTTLSLSIDDNGNTGSGGAQTGTASAAIDLTALAAPSLSITSAALVTTDGAQTVSGSLDTFDALGGAIISLYDGSTLLDTTTADGSGHWSANVILSGLGLNAITAAATNPAGTGTSAAVEDVLADALTMPIIVFDVSDYLLALPTLIAWGQPYRVTLTDTAANIAAHIDALNTGHVKSVTVSDPSDAVVISHAQSMTDDHLLNRFHAPYLLEITGITGKSYTSYDLQYGSNGRKASASYSDGETRTWTYNPDDTIHDIARGGITGQTYTGYDVTYDGSGNVTSTAYSYADGHTRTSNYNSDGSVHDTAYTDIAGQAYTSYDVVHGSGGNTASVTYSYPDGHTRTSNYNADGSLHDTSFGGIAGQAYTSYDVVYGSGGNTASVTYSYPDGRTRTSNYNADGSLHDTGIAGISGQTYTSYDLAYDSSGNKVSATYSNGKTYLYDPSGATAVTIFPGAGGSHIVTGLLDGLTISGTAGDDVITGGGGAETFSFSGAFGDDTLTDFAAHVDATDPNHDVLELSGYGGITDLSSLLAATSFSGGNALIAVAAGSSITIPGLSQSQIQGNSASFLFQP